MLNDPKQLGTLFHQPRYVEAYSERFVIASSEWNQLESSAAKRFRF